MPYIKVNLNGVKQYTSTVSEVSRRVDAIRDDLRYISDRLDWDVKSASTIERRINTILNDLDAEKSTLNKMQTFLDRAATSYTKLDGENKTELPADPLVVSAVYEEEPVIELTEEETGQIIDLIASETGETPNNIAREWMEKLKPADNWLSKIDKVLGTTEKYARWITGSTNLAFKLKDGYVIISKFTRSGVLNKITKVLHGSGIGTRYKPSTLLKTPGVGTLYAINKIANVAEVAAGVVDGAVKVLDASSKIIDVINDDSKSKEKKACDVIAIGATSVAAAALEVAAPIAGKAVTTAVAAAIPIPGLNVVAGVVAGAAVKGIMNTAAEVLTSEVVVEQVSSSIENMGKAVSSGVKTVSDAGKALLESKNAGEAVANTAKLVGTTLTAGVQTAATAVTEGIKTVTTVVEEAGKSLGNALEEGGKWLWNKVTSW